MKKSRGFTFIDVMVGTALVLIVFLGIFGAYQLTLKVVSQSKARITATALSNQKIETIRNLPYNEVGTIGGIPPGVIQETETISRNNLNFTVKTTIVFIDDPFDGQAPTDTLPTDYKRVKVKTSWSGRYKGEVNLVTDVAPKGVESEAGGGTLSVSVFDAEGLGVTQAGLHIVNNDVVPPVSANYQTDNAGHLILPGTPVSIEGYQITAQKSGYSTDRTYSNQEVTNPSKPQASVYEGKLTEIGFSIDQLSIFLIDTISPGGVASFSDSFLDETKIIEKFQVEVASGQVQLEPSHYSNIILPDSGRIKIEFVSESAGYDNSFGLYLPSEVGIFPHTDYSYLAPGTIYDLGLFSIGTELGFFISIQPNYAGQRWYTDQALNSDGFEHVQITEPGPNSWQLGWEDQSGGGDQDYDDLVVLVTLEPQGYRTPGYLISVTVTPENLTDWDKFYFTDDEPANTQINYQILYLDGSDWILVPDIDLPGNSSGFGVSPVDLSELSVDIYLQLRLKANLFTNDLSLSPTLYDWQIAWKTSSPVPVAYVPFKLEGTKTIGTDAEGKPVLKYSQNHSTDSSGHLGLSNLEWDSYNFSVSKSETGLDLIETQPVQPIDLLPLTTQQVNLVLSAQNSLLFTIKDSSTLLPIFAASCRAYNISLSYDVQQPTDQAGQAFFIPLEVATYNLEISSPGYQTYTGTVFVSGDTTLAINLTILP